LDPDLARKAAANLADFPNVSIQSRSGVEGPLPPGKILYVNAGATSPLDVWLESLLQGGRLLFPLTALHSFGAMLLVTRTTEAAFGARFVCQAAFTPCIGGRDEETARKLGEAFQSGGILNFQRKGGLWDVQSLRRNTQPDATCWFAGSDWWLSTAP